MSADLSNVAAYSTNVALEQVGQKAQVSVFNKQKDQVEAVAGKLLESIKDAPRSSGQTGQNLNIKA